MQGLSRLNARILLPVLLALAGLTCDDGLGPPPPAATTPGALEGTVRFLNWDSSGAVFDMRVVAFRVFPPQDVITEVLQGRAVVHPPVGGPALVTGTPDSVAVLFSLPPGRYPYVVVAQQFGPSVSTDWRPVGQYDTDADPAVPTPVTIAAGETTRTVDIIVDFTRLPPPPFR
jgi:hypothetical protein